MSLLPIASLFLGNSYSAAQTSPRRVDPEKVVVTLTAPAHLRPGHRATFRIEVRNASVRPVMVCKHPSFVSVEAVSGSSRALFDDAYEERAQTEDDWVVVMPGQRLLFHRQRRVAARAFGAASLRVGLAATGSAQIRPKIRPRILRKLRAVGAAWLPHGVDSRDLTVRFG